MVTAPSRCLASAAGSPDCRVVTGKPHGACCPLCVCVGGGVHWVATTLVNVCCLGDRSASVSRLQSSFFFLKLRRGDRLKVWNEFCPPQRLSVNYGPQGRFFTVLSERVHFLNHTIIGFFQIFWPPTQPQTLFQSWVRLGCDAITKLLHKSNYPHPPCIVTAN